MVHRRRVHKVVRAHVHLGLRMEFVDANLAEGVVVEAMGTTWDIVDQTYWRLCQ